MLNHRVRRPSPSQLPRLATGRAAVTNGYVARRVSCDGVQVRLFTADSMSVHDSSIKTALTKDSMSVHDSSIKTALTKEKSCIFLLSICASRELLGSLRPAKVSIGERTTVSSGFQSCVARANHPIDGHIDRMVT